MDPYYFHNLSTAVKSLQRVNYRNSTMQLVFTFGPRPTINYDFVHYVHVFFSISLFIKHEGLVKIDNSGER